MCYTTARRPKSYVEAKDAMSDEFTDADIDKLKLFLDYYLNAFDRSVDPVMWEGCCQLYDHLRWGAPWEWLKRGRDEVRKLAAERAAEAEARKAAKST